jgi:hypothetical protein
LGFWFLNLEAALAEKARAVANPVARKESKRAR